MRKPSDHRLRATTIAAESDPLSRRRGEPEVNALVIAFSAEEPWRVGELAIVPRTGVPLILGRGPSDEEPYVRFFRARPGKLDPTPPLASPALSRRQLEIRPMGESFEVTRVGQCAMRVNGEERDTATIRPGDTIRFRQELVLLCVRRAARSSAPRDFDMANAREFGEPDALGIAGEAPGAWDMRDAMAFAAKSDAHVLLLGESGTGKELGARAIHALSDRNRCPLVARNAATLPPGLIDSELFGNVKGYPNPGMGERPGLIGQAAGGVLFFDEIGELPPESQAHLLRVLDAGGEYQRLGEATMRRSDFRLIAATNRDPSALKHDLLARFPLRVELAPLHERREDIPLLARQLVLRAAGRSPGAVERFVETRSDGRRVPRFDARLIDELLRRDYPANARDLEASLWEAMAKSEGDRIAWTPPASPPAAPRVGDEPAPTREPTVDEIRAALERVEGSVTRAAKALGLTSRYALYRLMAKHGLSGGEAESDE